MRKQVNSMRLIPPTHSKKYTSIVPVLVSALLLGLVGLVASLGNATASTRPAAPANADGRVQIKSSRLDLYASEDMTSTTRLPLDLVIVLDASGSMNWTWDGYGSVSDATDPRIRKYANPNGDIPCANLLTLPIGCQSTEAYRDYTQRRIYQTKQAIKCYLDSTSWLPDDRVGLVTYNGGYNDGPGDVSQLTRVYPSATETLTGDIQGLSEEMLAYAASKNPGSSDPAKLYTTIGASPGALGLRRTNQVLNSAMETGSRQRAVIFMTDGVQNVYLNGYHNPDESINANYDPRNTKALPINQAIQQAALIKDVSNSRNARLYVVTLSKTFDQSGLDRIASEPVPPYLTSVSSGTELCAVLQAIQETLPSEPIPTVTPTSTATVEAPTSESTSEPTTSATSTATLAASTPTTTATLIGVNNAAHNQFLSVISKH